MSRVVASAPGKVVLFGEYAVLDGAPALAMAVNRRALASIVTVDGDVSSVTAAGYSDDVGQFRVTSDGLKWEPAGRKFKVVDHAWRAAEVSATTALRIELDTSRFLNSKARQKIGVGSSAAITVALCAALRCTAAANELTSCVYAAHSDLQGGLGSGVDVACSLYGGLIEYRMRDSDADPRVWPDGLHYRLIYSGSAASTRAALAKLGTVTRHSSRAQLVSAAEKMSEVWSTGEAVNILAEAENYSDTLRRFSEEHELGIYGAGHDDVWRHASDEGLFYKPCGAGGGDVGVVMGADDSLLEQFVQNLPANFTALDDTMSVEGVAIQTTECR